MTRADLTPEQNRILTRLLADLEANPPPLDSHAAPQDRIELFTGLGFALTDPDYEQFVFTHDDYEFTVLQRDNRNVLTRFLIDVRDYEPDFLNETIAMYYGTAKDFYEQYEPGRYRNMLIAEMLAETEAGTSY